jgi:hypothetical protein
VIVGGLVYLVGLKILKTFKDEDFIFVGKFVPLKMRGLVSLAQRLLT